MRCEFFTDFVQAHVEKTDENRFFIDKIATRKILSAAGLAMPTQYFIAKSIEEVVFDDLPDPVVLKLTNLSSKAGVYILYRIKNGYFDQLSKRLLTALEIRNEINKLTQGKPSPVMAEEVITGENGLLKIPFDYKVYVFNEKPEFILQINRNEKKDELAFFDGSFEPILDERVNAPGNASRSGEHVRPLNYRAMLESAVIAAKKIDRPFISVDMYTTGEKVYIGELTPTPGGPYYGQIVKFSDDFDRYLGELMLEGYSLKGWPIPEIKKTAPARGGK